MNEHTLTTVPQDGCCCWIHITEEETEAEGTSVVYSKSHAPPPPPITRERNRSGSLGSGPHQQGFLRQTVQIGGPLSSAGVRQGQLGAVGVCINWGAGWAVGGRLGAWGLSWGAVPTEGDAGVSGKKEMKRGGGRDSSGLPPHPDSPTLRGRLEPHCPWPPQCPVLPHHLPMLAPPHHSPTMPSVTSQ